MIWRRKFSKIFKTSASIRVITSVLLSLYYRGDSEIKGIGDLGRNEKL